MNQSRTHWRPIETAPKDGTMVLGYFPGKTGYVARQDVQPICWTGWGGGTWETLGGGKPLDREITHWTPLPEPPAAASDLMPVYGSREVEEK